MAEGKKPWRLEDLVDFEVAVNRGPVADAETGKELRESLRGFEGDETAKRRFGLLGWLRKQPETGVGARVETGGRLLAVLLFVVMFLMGVGVIRGLVTTQPSVNGGQLNALNIWVLLAGGLGVQWLMLIGGLIALFFANRMGGSLGLVKEFLAKMLAKVSGGIDARVWHALTRQKVEQRRVITWRLTRILQLAGVGFNAGLLVGFFGVLWFLKIHFYWESTLASFGSESLTAVTRFLSLGLSGIAPSVELIAETERIEGVVRPSELGEVKWPVFFLFAFAVWGLWPRLMLWGMTVLQERQARLAVSFQDPEHRQLWRKLTRVERTVVMEGMRDGVVLLDVGGLGLEAEAIRPFLLQQLRVNPEKSYAVSVLDANEEREAWEAIKAAPCGVIMLVEGWNLSPKQMTVLVERLRSAVGEGMDLRILVMGDGLEAPSEEDFAAWVKFVDGLRDPQLECVAFSK